MADPGPSQEQIDCGATLVVTGMCDGQCIELNSVVTQQLYGATGGGEGGAPGLVLWGQVVDFLRTVDAEANEHLVELEELGLLGVKITVVGLQQINDPPPGRAMVPLQGETGFKVIQTEKSRFAPVPEKDGLLFLGGRNIVPDEGFKDLLVHTQSCWLAKQIFLVQIVAVFTGIIAGWTGRLDQDHKWRRLGFGRTLFQARHVRF